MRKHHTLGRTASTRRIDQAGQIIALYPVDPAVDIVCKTAALGNQVIPP